MELCLIAPAAHVRQTSLLPGRFCLANVAQNCRSEYQEFFSDQTAAGYEVVLDNGAFEGELVSDDQYVGAINVIKPQVVVAPDLLNVHAQDNLAHAIEFADNHIKLLEHTQLMFVPQCTRGNDASYLTAILDAIKSGHFHWLGICRNACFNAFGQYTHTEDEAVNKLFFGAWAEQKGILDIARLRGIRFHLLGIGGDLNMLRYFWWVDRADTASLFFQATLGEHVSRHGRLVEHVSRPADYFRRDFGPPEGWLATLKYNCAAALIYASEAARLKHKILQDRI